jgi:hypothetical protein
MGDCSNATLEARIVRLETTVGLQDEAHQRALELQAREYDRRLNELNGEAARLLAAQQRSVTRELFDVKVAEIEKSLRPIPMIVAGASLVAAAIAALLVRLLVP